MSYKITPDTEIFTFEPADGSPPVNILSGILRQVLIDHMPDATINMEFPADETFASIVARHGLELGRLATMTEAEALEPVIVGDWNGTHILIDGGHRRAYWANRGQHVLRGWHVPEKFWRHFLVTREILLDPALVLQSLLTPSMGLPHRRPAPTE